jgi:hypothetical protein
MKTNRLVPLGLLLCTLGACQVDPNLPLTAKTTPENTKVDITLPPKTTSAVPTATAKPEAIETAPKQETLQVTPKPETLQTATNTISKYNQALQAFQRDSLKVSIAANPSSSLGIGPAPTTPLPSATGAPTESPTAAPNPTQVLEPSLADLKKLLQGAQELTQKIVTQLETTEPPTAIINQHNKLLKGYKHSLEHTERLLKEFETKELTLADLTAATEKILKEEGLTPAESFKQAQELADIQLEITQLALKEETQAKHSGEPLTDNAYTQQLMPAWNAFSKALTDSDRLNTFISPSMFLFDSQKLQGIQPTIIEAFNTIEALLPPKSFEKLHYTLLFQIKTCKELSALRINKPALQQSSDLYKDFELIYAISLLLQINNEFEKSPLSEQSATLIKQNSLGAVAAQELVVRAVKTFKSPTQPTIRLSWDNVPAAGKQIKIFRIENGFSSKEAVLIRSGDIASLAIASFTDQDPSLRQGQTYTYFIRIENAQGVTVAAGESKALLF